jgi:transposase InsO family protein
VLTSYRTSHKTYGYRRITLDLQRKQGLSINHKAVLRLMNKLGIRSVARNPNVYKRYAQSEAHHRYPNYLDRNFVAMKPNQKWVTDITYISTIHGWCYLSTIKDLYDGFIVSHIFQRNNTLELVTKTVRQAMEKQKVTDGLILHSDQGLQYTSQAYHEILTKEYNITASMSRRGNCWDNAPMENFFGHLKEEYLRHFEPANFEETEQLINEYIHFYNYERIQLKSRLTPFELRCQSI